MYIMGTPPRFQSRYVVHISMLTERGVMKYTCMMHSHASSLNQVAIDNKLVYCLNFMFYLLLILAVGFASSSSVSVLQSLPIVCSHSPCIK